MKTVIACVALGAFTAALRGELAPQPISAESAAIYESKAPGFVDDLAS